MNASTVNECTHCASASGTRREPHRSLRKRLRRAARPGALLAGSALLIALAVGSSGCGQSASPLPPTEGGGETPQADTLPQVQGSVPPSVIVGPSLTPKPQEPRTVYPKSCPSIFNDDVLQTFEIEMDPAAWAAMVDEFQNVEAHRAAGRPVEVYRDLKVFRHGTNEVKDAQIRLRGNPTYWPRQEKMQFQISFNEKREKGRYAGLRKLVLDSAHYNPSYMRDRLAMSIYRDVGVPAPCVNHARLYVNGTFYGLYANIEKVDREFLERNFDDPDANLYKRGQILKTNEDENPDTSRKDELWDVQTAAQMDELVDMPAFIDAIAGEAVFPDADGYWAGGWNFYFYDHPERGFVYIPWDIDLAFANLPANTDPLTWHKTNDNFNGRPHVELMLKDPKWRGEFIRAVRKVRDAYDPDVLQARIERWNAQIADSAAEDPHKPWTTSQFERGVERLHGYVADRAAYLDEWLACWEPHADDPGFTGPCP